MKLALSLVALGLCHTLTSQTLPPSLGGERDTVVAGICTRISNDYVDADRAATIADNLRGLHQHGKYIALSDRDFAVAATRDLQELSNDLHFALTYDPDLATNLRHDRGIAEESALPADEIERFRQLNYQWRKLEILEGNIGYVEFRDFFHPKYAGPTVTAAMAFVANCRAIILDLRLNGGGYEYMVQLLATYFLDADDPVHLSTFFHRPTRDSLRSQTLPYVTGRTFPSIPLFILTSRSTFSGAEAFAYALQSLKRATIIGERTRGGANIVEDRAVGNFVLTIPTGKPVSPITRRNWEGTGVLPDVAVAAQDAPGTAHCEAIEALLHDPSMPESERRRYEWIRERVRCRYAPKAVSQNLLDSYVGRYGDRNISCDGAGLLYQRGGRSTCRLTPMTESRFMIEGNEDRNLVFVTAPGGLHLEERNAGGVAVYESGRAKH